MRVVIIIVFLLSTVFSASAYLTEAELQSSLNSKLEVIATSIADEDKQLASDSIHTLLKYELRNPELFDFDFSPIKKMAILKPEDGKFMIFNWNVPLNSGGNEFYCFIATPNKDDTVNVNELTIPKRKEKKQESRYLDADAWYGCLYYDIIPLKKGNQYTILGYSPYSKASTRKYVDVLSIKNGSVRLGGAIFKTDRGMKKRLIYEFSAEVSMTIRHQEKLNRIILDHLVPRSAGMEGNYQFYGPDGTFDSLTLKGGTWILTEDVDFRSVEKSDKNYNDPRNRRR